jgi:hypothetical protein
MARHLVAGVVLGEPGCALENDEGEIRLRRRLDGEKDFSPGEAVTQRTETTRCLCRRTVPTFVVSSANAG